jgi:hypothetical protein
MDAYKCIVSQVKEAEEHAEQDKRLKDVAHARNDAESLIHSTEKSVQEHKMKIPAEASATPCIVQVSWISTPCTYEGNANCVCDFWFFHLVIDDFAIVVLKELEIVLAHL